MSDIAHLRNNQRVAHAAYKAFVEEAMEFVTGRGLDWNISLDANGRPIEGSDWDLRLLTGKPAKYHIGTGGFATDAAIREKAIAAGWALGQLQHDVTLPVVAQDFLKAVIVHRSRRGLAPSRTRGCMSTWRRLLTLRNKTPWELTREDFESALSLVTTYDEIARLRALAVMMDQCMLSVHVPVIPTGKYAKAPTFDTTLSARKDADKLPDKRALLEMVRIVFQEKPKTLLDAARFGVLRICVLTGLRVNEVLLLTKDCLCFEQYIDTVTGMAASDVGGVGSTVGLRYFGEKRAGGKADLLVEDTMWVPAIFEEKLVESVRMMVDATQGLRDEWFRQQAGSRHTDTDFRQFKTTEGKSLEIGDMLFLCARARQLDVCEPLDAGVPISLVDDSAIYVALGRNAKKESIFARYSASDAQGFTLKPHSLRHLMTTEMFRQSIPDTAITHHFGRKTVAESYEYDHRTLSERLQFVNLPAEAASTVTSGTPQELVAKMVVSGAIAGSHIAKSFKKIQAEHGDETAFRYLAANADGFHVTPYGFCINSFSVNPCARHLKCFDNCKHFTASGLPEHRTSLAVLQQRLVEMRNIAAAKPVNTMGRRNQIAHAEQLLTGVSKALDAQAGTQLFPEGHDHSAREQDVFA